MKLSATQRGVLEKMRDGWELRFNHRLQPKAWIEPADSGVWRPQKTVREDTFYVLLEARLIESDQPVGVLSGGYHLTDAGRAAIGDAT